MLDNIDEMRSAVQASNMLAPTQDAATPKGKIERISFALSRLDMTYGCDNSEHKQDCDQCANIFLEVCRDVLDGKGLQGE